MNIRWFLLLCRNYCFNFYCSWFRRCVTHVDPAGRPHSLYSRGCSCLATRFYYCCLIFSYVWAEPRLTILLSKVMGGGLPCHDLRRSTIVMPWSSPQQNQFSGQLGFLVFVLNVSLWRRVLPAETGENSICPVFNLRVPPRVGANRRVCTTVFWYLKMTQTFIWYVLLLRKTKTEDRQSVWFCSSYNGMADRIIICWVFWMDWTLC